MNEECYKFAKWGGGGGREVQRVMYQVSTQISIIHSDISRTKSETLNKKKAKI